MAGGRSGGGASPSIGSCPNRQFDGYVPPVTVSLLGFYLLALLVLLARFCRSQRNVAAGFKVLRWYNYGAALVLMILYVVMTIILYSLDACMLQTLGDADELRRASITRSWLYCISILFIVGTVLLAVPAALQRLRGAASSDGNHSGSQWTATTAVIGGSLLAVLTITMGIFLSVYTWAAASTNWDAGDLNGAFPHWTYFEAATNTVLLLVAMAAVVIMALHTLRAVPRSLRLNAHVVFLSMALFGNSFLALFFVYYYTIVDPGREYAITAAEDILWQVLSEFLDFSMFLALSCVGKALRASLSGHVVVGGSRILSNNLGMFQQCGRRLDNKTCCVHLQSATVARSNSNAGNCAT